MGDYGFEGAGDFAGQDTNFNCGYPEEKTIKSNDEIIEESPEILNNEKIQRCI